MESTGNRDHQPAAPGPDEVHECIWQILAARQSGDYGRLLDPPRTSVLLSCTICHIPISQILSGHWAGDLLGVAAATREG